MIRCTTPIRLIYRPYRELGYDQRPIYLISLVLFILSVLSASQVKKLCTYAFWTDVVLHLCVDGRQLEENEMAATSSSSTVI